MTRTPLLLLLLALLAMHAHAAPYRWVDAEGRVTYGDRPPPDATEVSGAMAARAGAASTGDVALPYALRSASARFPVRLYTAPGCRHCESVRAHLLERGVPFTESTLRTEADAAAFRALGFDTPLVPAVSVGRERMQNFGPEALGAVLDAAGYPKTSAMPRGWRPAPAAPLAGPNAVVAAPAAPGGPAPASPQARERASEARAAPAAAVVDEHPFMKPAATPRAAAPADPATARPIPNVRF